MPMHTLFTGPNRIEVPYGVYGAASGRAHKGVDIDTPPGQDATVHSTVSGTVEFAGAIPRGNDRTWEWGWHVRIIEGSTGHRHTFAHCKANSLLVKAGAKVMAGQAIATMGKTGNAETDAQAEHVHYQVDRRTATGWSAIEPTPWCGGNNKAGTWGPQGYGPGQASRSEGDDNMYRLYKVIYAYSSKQTAINKFNEMLAAGSRPGFDFAPSDQKYRIGEAVMAVQDPAQLFGQLDANYFIG